MSHIPDDATPAHRSLPLNWSLNQMLADLAGKPVAFVAKWMERSRDRMYLLDLDDRMLADIGITRREVEKLTDIAFWRL
ncbi:MAG TPA: DUF1127 domain-containing protein [Dongiaceae bacterium]|nr:DUF1127 domain-containing protein [Dongiaceae bacterium]